MQCLCKKAKHDIYFEFANSDSPKDGFKYHLWEYAIMCTLKKLDSVLYVSITSLNITKERLLHIFILSQTITNLYFQGSRDK